MPILPSTSHMHFSGSGTDTVTFGRPIIHLYITTGTGVTISFDKGVTFMPLADSQTHVLLNVNVTEISLTGGDWDGVGISL